MKNNTIFRIISFFIAFALLISFPAKDVAANVPQHNLGFSGEAAHSKDNNNDEVALGQSDALLVPDALNFTDVKMTIYGKPVNPNIPISSGSSVHLIYNGYIDDSTGLVTITFTSESFVNGSDREGQFISI